MFIEHFTAQEVQNLFLTDDLTILATTLIPIKGAGRNCLVVEYGYVSCEDTARAHFYVSDFEVRRAKTNETFADAKIDRIATADLREYLTQLKGEKYKRYLNDFNTFKNSGIII